MKTQILAAISEAELQPAASLNAALAAGAPFYLAIGRLDAAHASR